MYPVRHSSKAVLTTPSSEILIVEGTTHDSSGNALRLYNVPGGERLPDELPLDALMRELGEELPGINATDIQYRFRIDGTVNLGRSASWDVFSGTVPDMETRIREGIAGHEIDRVLITRPEEILRNESRFSKLAFRAIQLTHFGLRIR